MVKLQKVDNKQRTIIDITQLVHWTGRLTGIPRVMNELSMRYSKIPETIFVVWSKDANCFYELDINKSLGLRGQGIFYKNKNTKHYTSTAISDSPQASFFSAAKRLAKKIEKHNPDIYRKLATGFNKHIQTNPNIAVVIDFHDELIVLWGEWADEKYLTALIQAKDKGASLVQVVYDILPIVTPQYSGHSTTAMLNYYTQIIPISDLVLSISEYTKKDLTKWLNGLALAVPPIEVFRLGDDFALAKSQEPTDVIFKEKVEPNSDFILCVGTIEARKNHTLLYYVYKLAKERREDLPKLVIVGRRGWKTDDIFDIISNDPDVKDSIIFMLGVSDDELSWLYKNCAFTIYPSFYEGWGLPIAESIAYGKPCISSNTSSMPEVAGHLIDYFSPLSTDQCLSAIRKLMSKDRLDEARSKISNYKVTSWDDTFMQFNNALKEIYAKKN